MTRCKHPLTARFQWQHDNDTERSAWCTICGAYGEATDYENEKVSTKPLHWTLPHRERDRRKEK